ncbi:MAG: hypothetical protein JW850_14940 [Thermoflexales bacterium]|nr:hypothetical protein [Thermoflexales bacterium]
MEERIRFVDYKGKRILLEDFSSIRDEREFLALIKQAEGIVQSQPPKSVLVAVELTGARFSSTISQASKEASARNTPYVKASAMVGVKGLMQVMLKAVSTFAHRELVSFDTREQAMEWLIRQ